MEIDLQRYETNYKLGRPVIEPSGREGAYDRKCIDCPFVFFHNGKCHLMHIGFDGRGYQTAIATADTPEGPFEDPRLILSRNDEGRWDSKNAAGIWLLSTQDMFRTRTLKKWDGKYWLYYHSYPEDGYESGSAAIGAAWCDKEDLSEWHRLEEPILTIPEGEAWDHGGLYKNCVVEHNGKWYLFYNAKNQKNGPWIEQIGVCVGDDPLHFVRFLDHPVLTIGEPGSFDDAFASEPWVTWSEPDQCWVMYYFGFDCKHACDSAAFSKDLIHWQKAGSSRAFSPARSQGDRSSSQGRRSGPAGQQRAPDRNCKHPDPPDL